MPNRPINVLMSLKDKFSAPMGKVSKKTKEAQKQFKLAQNTINKFGSSANAAFLSLTKNVSAFGAATAAAGAALATAGLKQLAAQSMEAAKIQIQAETKLETMLSNVASLREAGAAAQEKAAKALKGYASELQNVGIIGDEATLSGMAQLATYQLNEKQIKTLSKGMLDLTAKQKGYDATVEDVVEAGKKLGEATQGNIGALQECGIFVDEATQEWFKYASVNERVEYLQKLLQNRVGGVNQALAETDTGKSIQAMNAWGDLTEEIGKKLLPFKEKLWSAFGEVLPKLQDTILPIMDDIGTKLEPILEELPDKLSTAVDNIPEIVEKIKSGFSTFMTIINNVKGLVTNLLPVILGLVAGFTAFNIITKVSAMFGTLTTIIQGVSAAGGILNFVMSMNPFGLVAVAIGVLVTAFTLLYQKSETFRNAVQKMWAKLKEFGSYIADIFGPYIKEQLGLLIDFIKNVFTGNWSAAWDNVKEIFKNKFELLKNIAKKPIEYITGLIDKVKEKISNISFGKLFRGGKEEHNALGTGYFKGGSTYVNEGNRGELINLPSGSQIIPHDIAARAAGGQNINISLNIQGNVIGNDDFYNECGRVITARLKTALANM